MDDLALFAFLQVHFFAAGVLAAKFFLAGTAYGNPIIDRQLGILTRIIPDDLLIVGACILCVLLARRAGRLPRRLRLVVFIGLFLALPLALAVSFINVLLYTNIGVTINLQVIELAPVMVKHLVNSAPLTSPVISGVITVLLALTMVPPLVYQYTRPHLVKDNRWGWRPILACAAFGSAGLFFAMRPALGYRDSVLREMTLLHCLSSQNLDALKDPPPITPAETQRLKDLCSAGADDGTLAFSKLPRRKYNILIWVYESVGERYLKSHHPLGLAQTPNLDRLEAAGSVRFTRCFSECPLSVESGWALATGMSPPLDPVVFLKDGLMPPHEPILPAQFKPYHYHTAHFNGDDLAFWGLDRVFGLGGYDLIQDYNTFKAQGTHPFEGGAYSGRAVTDAFLDWLKTCPNDEPFYSVLWNVETHHPYYYVGMPKEWHEEKNLPRYIHSIEHADELFGEMCDELERRGRLKDTIIVVIGDHGEGQSRPPRPHDRTHSRSVYEDPIHVPLVFLNPGLKDAPLHQVSRICTHADLYLTLLDLCGIETSAKVDGSSLARRSPQRPLTLFTYQVWPAGLRCDDYKLVLTRPDGAPELYNVTRDPTESVDLSYDQVDLTHLLMDALLRDMNRRIKAMPAASQ